MGKERKENYSRAVPMGGGLYPVGDFPLITDADVGIGSSEERLIDYIPIVLTPAEYYGLEQGRPVTITRGGETITLTEIDERQIYFLKLDPHGLDE